MKHIITMLMALMLIVAVLYPAGYSQEEMTHVDNDMFAQPQRPIANFKHESHNETAGLDDCTQCHHLYEEGQLVEDESSEDMRCAECHDEAKVDNIPSLMQAYHLNCKGCHLDQKNGPIMCGECHVR